MTVAGTRPFGRLDGRRAFVSGGAQGIGAAIVRSFADAGAHVLIADLDLAKASDLAGQVGATAVRLDVADIEADRGRTDLPREVGCSGNIEIADHDMRPGLGKTSHDRRTDALRAARHEGAAAVEPPERPGAGNRHRLASRKDGLPPLDHGGEPFPRVGHP